MTFKTGGTGKGSDHSRIKKEKFDKGYDFYKKVKDFSENAVVTKKNNKTIYKY